jgi:anaerobic selenocysteine-containing dehydrogenase
MRELKKTTCNRDCPDVCGLVATVEDGRVTRLQGDKDHPITRGFLCYRTGHFLERQYSPERLTQPLLRRGDGFVPIPWADALDLAAQKLIAFRKESGPASIFHYRSGGSLGIITMLTEHFFEQFGPVTIKRGDICSGAGDAAQMMDFGEEDSHDVSDLINARHILLWGKNIFISSPHLLPILKEAKARGARLTLVDPVAHQTASLCDRFIQPRPGSDFSLAMAVGALLFANGWVDPAAGNYCDHLDGFRALCNAHPVEHWCAQTDVTVEDATWLARALGVEKPCATLVGWGMGRRVNGAAIVRALDALAAVSGNLGVEGGGVSFYYKRRGAFDASFIRGEAVAPRTVCEPLFGREVQAMKDPPIRAVWVTAGNPVTMLPESHVTAEALRTREFTVVVDTFMTDTARQATLVLPTTTLLESDDLLGSYGHHYLAESRPVVPPPDGVLSDLQIMQGLAERTGLSDAMAGDAETWKRRVLHKRLSPHGVTLETLRQGAVKNPLAQRILFEDRVFPTPSGRVNLIHEMPPSGAASVAGFPLTLMAVSTEKSQSSQWTRPLTGPLRVTVHPDSAHGIPHGGGALLQGEMGSLEVVVEHDASQRRDVLLTHKGGHLKDGRCTNAITRARLTDLGEGGALYDEKVRLVPVNQNR